MSSEPMMHHQKLLCLLLLLLSCAASSPARAQSSASPAPASSAALAAESAFLDGLRLMKQGDCQKAALRFEESQRFDPASGTLLNLAYCQTQLGKTASAWLAYRQAIALAERTGKPAHAQLAREQGEKLEGALPRLRLALIGDASRLAQLTLDGQAVLKETWSLSVPVDPGPHRVVAVFDTGKSWETEFLAQPGQESVVEVEMPQADARLSTLPHGVAPVAAPLAAPASTPADSAPPPARRAPPPAPAEAGPSGWVIGLGLAGAGAVVAGTALFVSARLSYDAARDHCTEDNVCSDAYYEQQQSARSRSTASFILAGSGVLLLGTAAVLHFGASPGGQTQSQLSAALLGPRDFAATYRRSF